MNKILKEFEPRVISEINRVFYLSKRYNIQRYFALLYTENSTTFIEISKFIRTSDRIIPIDKNHYLIIYTFIDCESKAYKAAQNLLYKLDNLFNNQLTWIALSSFDENNSVSYIINRLFVILREVKKHSLTRVEFDDILDRI